MSNNFEIEDTENKITIRIEPNRKGKMNDEFNNYSGRYTNNYSEQRVLNELFYQMLKVNEEQEYFHQLTCIIAIDTAVLGQYQFNNDELAGLIENISKLSVKDKKTTCFYPICHKIGMFGNKIKVMLDEVVCDDLWSKFTVDEDNVYTRSEPLHNLQELEQAK